ncbi:MULTISPECIES: hypothetical protein [Providencia]|uniref:hypothetical protein n=1 Tax=Providencia TaxID=586 RepID=UPI0013DF32C1|nr:MULTISPECIES: hypothetical protein [Providencia]MDH2370007.1 hypothetical protein [Providencia rettgeri]MDL9985976.1 hypothetical protein [Providencia rettgeri]QIF57746.1 hypothetical protein FVA69_09890 [Providencia sp. 1701011]QIF61790.1 hypothetical protein FVA70_09900 [Providencia sp. 1701091]QZY66042.1 hypothetical protein K7H99_08445 [Providencia rettgeri]
MKTKKNIVHFGNVKISKQDDKPLDMMADSCIVEGFDHLDGKGYSLQKKVAIAILESLIEEVKLSNEI